MSLSPICALHICHLNLNHSSWIIIADSSRGEKWFAPSNLQKIIIDYYTNRDKNQDINSLSPRDTLSEIEERYHSENIDQYKTDTT